MLVLYIYGIVDSDVLKVWSLLYNPDTRFFDVGTH